MTPSSSWSVLHAPTLADFEQLAAEAWEKMPDTFRKMCGDVLIRVEDFPEDDVLAELGLSPDEVLQARVDGAIW